MLVAEVSKGAFVLMALSDNRCFHLKIHSHPFHFVSLHMSLYFWFMFKSSRGQTKNQKQSMKLNLIWLLSYYCANLGIDRNIGHKDLISEVNVFLWKEDLGLGKNS